MDRNPAEAVLVAASDSARGVREHYELMLRLAKKCAEELRCTQFQGLPKMGPGAAGPHARLARLINSFAWANRSLFNAAKDLVVAEDLPDDGRGDGIVFEVLL